MAYQSPLHIISALDLSPNDIQVSDLKRLQKKIMAEFTLSQEITIRIGNAEYSKDDVIKLLDELAGLQQIDSHLAIFRNSEILKFCEFPEVSASNTLVNSISNFAEDKETPSMARIILGEALLEALAVSIKKREFSSALIWHALIQKQFSDFTEQLQEVIVLQFIDLEEMIEAVDEVNYSQANIEKSVHFLTQDDWVDYLNFCIDEYREIIESFVNSIINLTVRLQFKQKKFCALVGSKTIKLNVNKELENLLISNYKIYDSNYSIKSGISSIPWGLIVWVLLLSLKLCNSCDDKKYDRNHIYENNSIFPLKEGDYFKNLDTLKNLDSIIEKYKNKIPAINLDKFKDKVHKQRKELTDSAQKLRIKDRESLQEVDSLILPN